MDAPRVPASWPSTREAEERSGLDPAQPRHERSGNSTAQLRSWRDVTWQNSGVVDLEGILLVIDSQLHEPPVSLSWVKHEDSIRWDVLVELELLLMDAVGVDRAVLFPLESRLGEVRGQPIP